MRVSGGPWPFASSCSAKHGWPQRVLVCLIGAGGHEPELVRFFHIGADALSPALPN